MGNPILIIIIVGGLFNAAVRIAQKAKEQRARRDAFNAMAHEKSESLRTGRSGVGGTGSTGSQAQSFVQTEPKQTPESIRQERIEALRKERIEQLRALREKRSATTQTSSSPISQNHPNLPPIPVSSTQRPSQRPSQSQSRPSPQPNQLNAPAIRRRVQSNAPVQPALQSHETVSRTVSKSAEIAVDPYKIKSVSVKNSKRSNQANGTPNTDSVRSMLHSRSTIRQAMVLREVLDTPVGLRENDVLSGSLF